MKINKIRIEIFIIESKSCLISMARIVKTHSTYIEGLLKVLEKLSEEEAIKTIIPAEIKKIEKHKEKLEVKIYRETIGGYMAKARKGRSLQQLYIITKCDRNEIEMVIKKAIRSKN